LFHPAPPTVQLKAYSGLSLLQTGGRVPDAIQIQQAQTSSRELIRIDTDPIPSGTLINVVGKRSPGEGVSFIA
jgi:hypothetical protein